MINNKKINYNFILFVILHFVIATTVALFVYFAGNFPQGNDIYGHWFKTNVLYDAMKNGTLFPTYTPLWYNGIDLFRYWPPFSYYVLAFFMMPFKGDIEIAYPIFLGFMYFLGAFGWLLFGKRENKMELSFFVGILFFLLPDNMRVMFSEGNMPRMIITAMLPCFYFFVFDYVKYQNKKALVGLSIVSMLMIFSHIMISAMIGISTFLVLLFYGITNKQWKSSIIVLLDIVFSYLSMGIILLPSLTGGILSQNSSASVSTSADWSQNLFITLNPISHIKDFELFYFGLPVFLIIAIGLFIKTKEVRPFFASTLIILISTSNTMVRFIGLLPFSQVFWMQRFVPIALTLFLIALIYWKRCRKLTMCVFLLLIVIDSVPTLQYFNPKFEMITNECTLGKSSVFENDYLLNEAKSITTNRLSFMDLSNTNSYPSYFFSKDISDGINYLFGWAYQGAKTEKEIVRINEAFEYGFYYYSLDRMLEMGCDTIVVKRDEIGSEIKGEQDWKEEKFLKDASSLGYRLVDKTDKAFLLKYNFNEDIKNFGTITTYTSIAIGSSSHYIAYLYPEFKIGESDCLDDYNFAELLKYKKIYLSNFSYINKEKVENTLKTLSNLGVEIYIDMDNIPMNDLTQKKEFLGVHSQFVTFTESFPIISMKNGSQFKLPMNTESYDKWYCSYLTGLNKNQRSSTFPDTTGVSKLNYYGTSENENIHFIGFNLIYYCASSHNEQLMSFMDEIFGLKECNIPDRKIVPIETTFTYQGVEIHSNFDNVNVGISNLDGFVSDKIIKEEHSLVIVDKGTTYIKSTYPYLLPSVCMSIFGLLLLMLLFIFVYKYSKCKKVF